MVEGERLIPVFQGTARETSGTRRLDTPTRTRRRNTRDDLLAMRRRDGGGLAVDGAEDVVNGLRSIIERHDDSWLG